MVISVIIPVYNKKEYLQRCISSLRNQTIKNMEIILVDDGSSDGSSEICDEYAELDKRIIVIHQLNSGVSKARNVGLKKSNGMYISFVDADDYLDHNTYEVVLEKMKVNNCDIGIFGMDIDGAVEGDNYSEESTYDNRSALICLMRDNLFHASVVNKIFKKDLVKKIKFDEMFSMGEDLYFAFSAIKKCKKVIFYSEVKYHIVLSKESICRTAFRKEELGDVYIWKKIWRKNYDEMIKEYAFSRYIRTLCARFWKALADTNVERCIYVKLCNEIKSCKNIALKSRYVRKRNKIEILIADCLSYYWISKLAIIILYFRRILIRLN